MQIIKNTSIKLYSNKLRSHLLRLQTMHPDSLEILALTSLCSEQISQFDPKSLDQQLISQFENELSATQNSEIKARWNEISCLIHPSKKRELLPEAVQLYLGIYKELSEIEYLIHALKIIRSAKALFKDCLETICGMASQSALNLENPFLLRQMIVHLYSIDQNFDKGAFKTHIESLLAKSESAQELNLSEEFVYCLADINVLGKNESNIRLALNLEKKGDKIYAIKEQNTFYPTILSCYTDALLKIKGQSDAEELKQRLNSKIIREQQHHVQMHVALSSNFTDDQIQKKNIIQEIAQKWLTRHLSTDFKSGLDNLIAFPIIAFSEVKKNSDSKDSFLSAYFNDAFKRNEQGRITAKTSVSDFLDSEQQSVIREAVILFIRKTKWNMDLERKASKNEVEAILRNSIGNFIPTERMPLYIKGIHAGFENDFITSAHILIPQLENSMKFILQRKEIITFKIAEEVQHDNTLGGILDKLIEQTGNSMYCEVKDFLTETHKVNFRNELLHGLLPPAKIYHYGIYTWWLSLKLIFGLNDNFESGKKA